MNKITTITVNTQGQPLTIKDPLNNITTFTYELGDLISVKDPLNRTTTRMLDAAGRLRSLINPLGQKTIYTPDALDRITQLTDAINGVTQFGYDANSNLLTVTDAKTQQTVYTYSNMNRTATRKDPLLNTESYTYDNNGNLATVTDRKSQVTTNTYDALNRRTKTTFQDGTSTNYTYYIGVRSCNHTTSDVNSRAMARPLRLEFPGAVYHVTSRGNARQNIVADDRDRTQFLALLAHVVDRYRWVCHAYCVMDNHYHLLIETPQPNLSLGMRQLNGRYTQTYNRRHERVGHLFQGRFAAILVEKEAHLLELCRYVVLNPVRANLVSHPRHWAWSSYRATVGETAAPPFLTTDWILGHFGQRVSLAQEQYRTFVAEGRGGPRPWEQLIGQIYLGSESFIAQHQPDRVIREIPRRQTQAQRPPLRVLFQRKDESARLIHTAYRRYGYRLAEIAAHLGVHAATVSRRLKQAEQGTV